MLSVIIVGPSEVAHADQRQPEEQNIIFGGLLLLSVLVPNGGEAVRRLRGAPADGPVVAARSKLAGPQPVRLPRMKPEVNKQ